MKTIKLLVVLTLLFTVSSMFAAYIQVTFKDASNPNQTRALVMAEAAALGFSYVNNQPTANRWVVQVIKDGGNETIDPINPTTLAPTGDDVIAVTNAATQQGVNFLTNTLWTMSSIKFYDDGTTGNTFQGDKVYLRIFNATAANLANATKMIQFTNLYTVPAITATPDLNLGAFSWTNWTLINPVSYVAPYAPTAGLPTGTVGWTGQALSWTAPATDATHRAAASYNVYYGVGAYGAPINAWVSTSYTLPALLPNTTYMAKVEAVNADGTSLPLEWTFTTREEINPQAPVLVAPVADAALTTVWPATTMDVVLEWSAPIAGQAPTGYKLNWNGNGFEDMGALLTVTKTGLAAGTYTWEVKAYYTDGGAKGASRSVPVSVRSTNNQTRGDGPSANRSFTIAEGVAPTSTVEITSDWDVANPVGARIWVNGVDSGFNTPHTFTMLNGTNATYSLANMIFGDMTVVWDSDYAVNNIAGNLSHQFIASSIVINTLAFDGNGYSGHDGAYGDMPVGLMDVPGAVYVILQGSNVLPQDVTVTVPGAGWYVKGFWSGAWHNANPYPSIGTTVVLEGAIFGAKADVPVVAAPAPIPLPIELSSFTAVLTAQYFVNLTWVTESETQVLGFNVYRSESDNFSNAVRVNANTIAATNTSDQHSYTLVDREVETGTTYWYWLENVDMAGSQELHGPQSVIVTGDPTPVLPEISMLNSAYPNPFRSGSTTNINVSIKAGETGTVTVYNILGQVVKSYKVSEGNHTLKWDGKNCGSGIYFYKLNTPTTSATKKLVIVK